ncbi:piggyBac transposable element-derived protein 3 [Biomphalaria glabrata]|nr:piggyBac transposable element-derived protein 3 [Biomphalaria glabrata]
MIEFEEEIGGIHGLPDSSTPLDYFKLFIDDDIIDMIVEQTNLYAEQQQRNKGPDKYWKPVDQDDIVRFVYINMYFGIVKLPNTRMYWLGNKMWRIEGVAAVMGRCRFEKIRQYIHLMDKEKMPPRGSIEYDPIYKLLEEMMSQKRNKRALTESPSVAGKCKPSSSDHQSRRMPGRQRRCFQCAEEGKKTGGGRSSETCFGCHMCDIHLHKGYCFAKFHESIKN